MNIGINARIFNLGIGYGLTSVGINLFSNLLDVDKENNYFFFCNDDFELPFVGNYQKIIIKSNKIIFDWVLLPQSLAAYKIDVFLSPQTTIGLLPSKIKSISIVNDIGYEYGFYSFFDNLYWKLNFRYSLRKANKVVAISKFTMDEIKKKYNIDYFKLDFAYLGKGDFFSSQSNDIDFQKLGINKKFILCLGSDKKRKNIGNAIKAFNKIKNDFDVELVIITRDINNTKKVFGIENENFDKIIFLEKISNDVLRDLYSNCEFTLIPSIYEGFGLPLIEAQSCGSLVLNSDNSSLHEVSGNTSLEFNPFDINDISLTLEKALNLTYDQKKLYIDKGFENIKRFDWKVSANKYLQLINDLGKKQKK